MNGQNPESLARKRTMGQWAEAQGGVYLKEATTSKKLAVSHVVQATLTLAMIAKEDIELLILMPPLPRR